MSKKTVIAASPLTPTIYAGTSTKPGVFDAKVDVTDDVLLAVADYVKNHFKGRLKAEYTATDSGHGLTINVQIEETP